jgi:glycosyltransferase involved in cell wall biosynthesis
MIIPMIAWLKLFGIRIVFDAHDISTETLKGKMATKRSPLSLLLPMLEQFESLSIRAADLAIATNESILDRIRQKSAGKRAWIVRNGNATVYDNVDQVGKPPANGDIRLGYFGVLANDRAAGLDNILIVARALASRGVPFKFSIVGSGPGLPRLKQMVVEADMTDRFEFHGFIPIPQAYQLIKSFDFGFVSWGDTPKNNLHTAMKVMDYMCCAVPVCCLELREQIRSTNGIGVHGSTFEEIAGKLVLMHENPTRYEVLRRQTLERFNTALCWELQERNLLEAYKGLSLPA